MYSIQFIKLNDRLVLENTYLKYIFDMHMKLNQCLFFRLIPLQQLKNHPKCYVRMLYNESLCEIS